MSNTAAKVTVEGLPVLTDGVTIKVADSRKCVSIYGIGGNRMPINFTVEQWDNFVENFDAIHAFVEGNRDKLLTQSQRKLERQSAKKDAKLLSKAEQEAEERRITLMAMTIAKALKA